MTIAAYQEKSNYYLSLLEMLDPQDSQQKMSEFIQI